MKLLDFEYLCKVSDLMKDKKHLTKTPDGDFKESPRAASPGIEEIRGIKAGMNQGRK